MKTEQKTEPKTQNALVRAAIITRYLGPTNSRGSRIKSTSQAGCVTISWDYSLSIDDNHCAACAALLSKIEADNQKKHGFSGWGELAQFAVGCLPSGERVFVKVEGVK